LSLSSAAGTFDAQCDFTSQLKEIPTGESSIELEIGPLHLRQRPYHISISIHDQSRKVTIVHAIGIASFEFQGPLGFGVAYQVPAAANARCNGQSRETQAGSLVT
jgi:hypothetical protein